MPKVYAKTPCQRLSYFSGRRREVCVKWLSVVKPRTELRFQLLFAVSEQRGSLRFQPQLVC
jgi:hypothetical protein